MTLAGRLRYGVKRGLEIAIVRSGLAERMSRNPKRSRLILAYHNVVADDDPPWGERALHLRRSLFERHVDLLEEKGRIVPLRELLEDMDPRGSDGPRFALTFDDAYQGAVEAIEVVLAPRGIPCTVFVNPGLLGTEAFWWDRLAETFGGSIPPALREECLADLRGEREKVEARMRADGHSLSSPPCARYAPPTSEELERLRKLSPLVKLGSHTWSHPNLAALSAAEVRSQVERCRGWLDRFGETEAGILAYPYGLASPTVLQAMPGAGVEYGLLVEGGYVPEVAQYFGLTALPRLPVPAGLTEDGLMLRVGGLR